MEIKCFLCETYFCSSSKLFLHLKQHEIPANFGYECTVQHCNQNFYTKFSYKRHIIKHFKLNNENLCTNSSTLDQNDCSEMEYDNIPENNIPENNIPENNIPNIYDYQKKLSELYDCATHFMIKLHSVNNFSRSDANKVKNMVEEFVVNPILNLIEEVTNPTLSIEKDISVVINDSRNLFNNISSDYKLEKCLVDKGLIGTVEQFEINQTTKSSGSIMPLEFQFQKIFEQDNYLDDVLKQIKETESSPNFVNFVQGDLWQQKKSLYPRDILIPYFLYADDFGINNPIGSKSNKHSVCNFYYSFPCVPVRNSKLNQVFLACTIKSSDIKVCCRMTTRYGIFSSRGISC